MSLQGDMARFFGVPGQDLMLAIGMGRIPGYYGQFVIGVTEGLDIADGLCTIWDYTGQNISFLSAETELFVSSASASDTTNQVLVSGLDSNYEIKTTTTTIGGQSQVSVGTFLRVQNCIVLGTSNVGDIYIAESDTLVGGVPQTPSKVQSKILAGKVITHNGWFTVPAGKTAVNMSIRGTVDATSKAATVRSYISSALLPTAETVSYSVTAAFSEYRFPTPVATANLTGLLSVSVPSGTDIEFKAEVNTNATDVFFGTDFIVAPEEDFLTANLLVT